MKPYFFIRCDKKFIKINYSEMVYIEACGNYSTITNRSKA
jgi:hypothetical protein